MARNSNGKPASREIPAKSTVKKLPFSPKNEKQGLLYKSVVKNPMTIALGPAGTGKSFVIANGALDLYFQRAIKNIIIARPPIPTGTSLGFFPGTEAEKLMPWMSPILSTLKKAIGTGDAAAKIECMLGKSLHFMPTETLKGSSFDDSFIIIEEAQECDEETLRMLLTRAGENSIVCLNGDLVQYNHRICKQADHTALGIFVKNLRAFDSVDHAEDWARIRTPVIEFNKSEIVRSDLTRKMVEVFYPEK